MSGYAILIIVAVLVLIAILHWGDCWKEAKEAEADAREAEAKAREAEAKLALAKLNKASEEIKSD